MKSKDLATELSSSRRPTPTVLLRKSLAVFAALLVPAMVLLGVSVATASAATAPRPPVRVAPNAVSGVGVVGCYFQAIAPFFLTTTSNKMYAQGKVTSCTTPAPQACRMQVDLYVTSVIIGSLGHYDSGWVSCGSLKSAKSTPAFICHTTPAKYDFYTQVFLQVEYNGAYGSNYVDSGKVAYYCQP